ncbi:MAG: glycosyltransferase family 9 protein [Candidatus Eremiobacterota bacterium]
MKRALVILAHGGIGDIILATPVLKSIREELSLEFLAMLVNPYAEDILSENPYVDEIILDKDPCNDRERAPFFYLLNKIKSYNFDIALVLWSTARFAWMVYFSGIPVRVGQDFRLLYSFLYTKKVRLRTVLEDRESHWVDCLMDFAREAGAGMTEPELCLPVNKFFRERISDLLESHNIQERDLLVGFHPGRGVSLSDWPYENFAAISDAIQRETGAKLVITGGENERDFVSRIEASMKTKAVNMAGKLSLKELIALIKRCNVFISMDSGPMHIAAACKTPTVAIFALKSDLPPRWKPYKCDHIVVRKDTSCKEKCIKEQCKKFTCLAELTEEDIVNPVRIFLKKNSEK